MSASPLANPLLVVVLLLNLFMLGSSRVRAVIRAAAMQGAVLGVLSALLHGGQGAEVILLSVAVVALKGIIIPRMLLRAMREARIRREVEPLVGLVPSMLLGALGTAIAAAFAARLPLPTGQSGALLLPASLATVLTGFILLTTRLKAITQVVGYLVLENGIFIFGLLLLGAMPLLVEIGALLDLFVGVFVISIIINHISREFASLDTRHLSSLRD